LRRSETVMGVKGGGVVVSILVSISIGLILVFSYRRYRSAVFGVEDTEAYRTIGSIGHHGIARRYEHYQTGCQLSRCPKHTIGKGSCTSVGFCCRMRSTYRKTLLGTSRAAHHQLQSSRRRQVADLLEDLRSPVFQYTHHGRIPSDQRGEVKV